MPIQQSRRLYEAASDRKTLVVVPDGRLRTDRNRGWFAAGVVAVKQKYHLAVNPEHPEYLAVRANLSAPWQDILDVAYYSGWRKQEILGLTWDEIDKAGGVAHARRPEGRGSCARRTRPSP